MGFWRRILFVAVILMSPGVVWSAMTSTNYTIYADSINTGGIFSTSTQYSMQSTLGESPIGVASSTSYEIRGGYQAMERGYLTLDLSANTLNLGMLSTSSISAASTTATVSTDSNTGYSLSIGSATWASSTLYLADISGAFSAGTEAYGVVTSTVGGDDGGAFAVTTTAPNIFVSGSAIDNSKTVMTFKAAISSTTRFGDYAQTVVFQAAANF